VSAGGLCPTALSCGASKGNLNSTTASARTAYWERESLAPDAPLFASNRGTHLSTRQIRHGFAVWQRRAGFDRHVSFHVSRCSASSAVYRKTKYIRFTQSFARHKSILTTAVYSQPTDEDLVRVVDGMAG
jgi:site-specific recombinase XerC